MIPGTYIPRAWHQPRGKRPWCAGCDTDAFLSIETPAVTDRQTGILAVALHCAKCRLSKVFDTTAEYVGILALSPENEYRIH